MVVPAVAAKCADVRATETAKVAMVAMAMGMSEAVALQAEAD